MGITNKWKDNGEVTSKKYEAMKKHCSMLEKENEILKKEKVALEIQLVGYTHDLNDSTDRAKKILMDALVAKQMYTDGLKQLKELIEQCKGTMKQLKEFDVQTTKKFDKTINKEIDKMANAIK